MWMDTVKKPPPSLSINPYVQVMIKQEKENLTQTPHFNRPVHPQSSNWMQLPWFLGASCPSIKKAQDLLLR